MYRAVSALPEVATWVSASWRETVTVGSHADGVHPDGSIDIVWDGAALAVFGPRTRSEAPRDLRNGTYVGVRLRPGSTRAMLGESAIALADRTVALESLWGALRAPPRSDFRRPVPTIRCPYSARSLPNTVEP